MKLYLVWETLLIFVKTNSKFQKFVIKAIEIDTYEYDNIIMYYFMDTFLSIRMFCRSSSLVLF